MSHSSSPLPAPAPLAYGVGIDMGMESCTRGCLTREKRQVIKPSPFATAAGGLQRLFARLERLRGLRAKTHQVDAATMARALLSGEARFGYVQSRAGGHVSGTGPSPTAAQR